MANQDTPIFQPPKLDPRMRKGKPPRPEKPTVPAWRISMELLLDVLTEKVDRFLNSERVGRYALAITVATAFLLFVYSVARQVV